MATSSILAFWAQFREKVLPERYCTIDAAVGVCFIIGAVQVVCNWLCNPSVWSRPRRSLFSTHYRAKPFCTYPIHYPTFSSTIKQSHMPSAVEQDYYTDGKLTSSLSSFSTFSLVGWPVPSHSGSIQLAFRQADNTIRPIWIPNHWGTAPVVSLGKLLTSQFARTVFLVS